MSTPAYERLLHETLARPPVVGIVLGSGLNEITDRWPRVAEASFQELPGMPPAAVAGHRGRLSLHRVASRPVLVFQGRVHFYEGHSWESVARPVYIAAELGVRNLILTNAAGGIGSTLSPGSLMSIRGHIAAMRPNWWREAATVSPYSPELSRLVHDSASAAVIHDGVYASVTGPSYETPAEIRALRTIGADAVGMSTVQEAEAATKHGMTVAGISCIANWAAGISPAPLSHQEVLENVRAVAGQLKQLLESLIARL